MKKGTTTALSFLVLASLLGLVISLPVFFITWLFVGGDIVIRSGLIALLTLIITAVGIGKLNSGIEKETENKEAE